MAIILALAIGAGAAYGYYIMSTPKAPVNNGQPSSTPSSGAITAPYASGNISSATRAVVFVTTETTSQD